MEFLAEVNVECDYDKMCTLLVSAHHIGCVSLLFPGYNAKVLLTAFMIKNFPDVYADEILLGMAGEVCSALLGVDHMKLSKIYYEYFMTFSDWRKNDIIKMKTAIELQKETLTSVKDPDPSNEADEQWNEGIAINIKTLNIHIGKLDTYSMTPPNE